MYDRITITVTRNASTAMVLMFAEAYQRLSDNEKKNAPAIRSL